MNGTRKNNFGLISEINADDAETYKDKIFLTLDVDWAHDQVLADTLDLLNSSGARATWFVTHETSVLDKLRENKNFEIGIHPNFNPLLCGEEKCAKNFEEVVDRLLRVVPDAKCVRSHSMTQNFYLLDFFAKRGLTHDSNDFIPEQSEMELVPYQHWNGLLRVPFFWEDNVQCMYEENTSLRNLVTRPGLKIFNFHPIHVYLNTEELARYENSRRIHYEPEELIKHRSDSPRGAREILKELIRLVQ